MTDEDWALGLTELGRLAPRSGNKGRGNFKFLEAMHDFTLESVLWRALPVEFGPRKSVWKRFWRLREDAVFEALFEPSPV